jgi:transcriptional regulator with XRE-family HTH domain
MREFLEFGSVATAARPVNHALQRKAALPLNLKQLRGQRGLTLEQLAQRSGLTRSYLSKVERGISTPSIESALGISTALGISVESLFGHKEEQGDPITIVRAADGAAKDPDAYLTLVAGLNPNRTMRAFVVRPANQSGRGRPTSHHDGEELLFVLKGKIELLVGKDSAVLGPGDCVHFNSSMPHKLTSIGSVPASALIVISSQTPANSDSAKRR